MASSAMRPAARAPLPFLYPASCFRGRPLAPLQRRMASAASNRRGFERNLARQERSQRDGMQSLRVTSATEFKSMNHNDFGLMPDTFIMPTGANKPSILSWPGPRMRLEWHRLRTRVIDYGRILIAKWANVKPRPKLRTRQLPKIAQALHRSMYTAFADGDVKAIEEVCCSGLRDRFIGRIQARGRADKKRWVLHKYNGRARIVSHKAIGIPMPTLARGSSDQMPVIRQAVVRIPSKQSLEPLDGANETVQPKDLVEYVVMQQIWGLGRDKEQWRIWGTMDEEKDGWKRFIK